MCAPSTTCSLAPAGIVGSGRLAQALTIYRPDPAFTRSRFERRFRRLLYETHGSRPLPLTAHRTSTPPLN